MFYKLLCPLREIFFGFNVFRYITFRAAMAGITSFLLCIAFGPWLIRKLSQLKIGEHIIDSKISPSLHELHRDKSGVPTMGGILILLSVIVCTLLWARLDNKYVSLVLFSTLWLGIIGFMAVSYTHLTLPTKRIV